MDQDFFKNLPLHIIIDVLSRLPIRTIIHCKCVCKSWLDSIGSPEFVDLHLSRSVPGLAFYHTNIHYPEYKIYEFEDALDLEHHELHYKVITIFDLPYDGPILGSAKGLLLLQLSLFEQGNLRVCNPITREYIELQCPQDSNPQVVTFGFGTSKTTNQLKVVRVFHDNFIHDEITCERLIIRNSGCDVYTLGTGSWRRVNHDSSLQYSRRSIGAFLHGNLHWLVWDLKGLPLISCFDLETELFSTINVPDFPRRDRCVMGVYAFNDCLCLSDNSSGEEIVVWLMKEYGVEESWNKEFVMSKRPGYWGRSSEVVWPIKVFKDGDVLMAWQNSFLFYCSVEKSRGITVIDMFDSEPTDGVIGAILHNSTFLSLTTSFNDTEDVRSF